MRSQAFASLCITLIFISVIVSFSEKVGEVVKNIVTLGVKKFDPKSVRSTLLKTYFHIIFPLQITKRLIMYECYSNQRSFDLIK